MNCRLSFDIITLIETENIPEIYITRAGFSGSAEAESRRINLKEIGSLPRDVSQWS
jgi:hypothetical protein